MDAALLRAINALRNLALDRVVSFLNAQGGYAFPLALLVAFAMRRDRARGAALRDGVLAWLLALTVAEDFLKPIFARPRPSAVPGVRETIHVLGRAPPPGSLSFPSGSAAMCFAGATMLWLRYGPRVGIPFALVAASVGLGRVYTGVHFPSDVLGGALVGVAIAFGVDRFARWIDRAPHAPTN